MSRLRNLYLYLVSFVTLMMILGGLIGTISSVSDILFPVNYDYNNYDYMEPRMYTENDAVMTGDDDSTEVSDKQIIKDLKENPRKEQDRINKRNSNIKSIISSLAVIGVATPTFLYHWKKIEEEKPVKAIKETK